MTPTNYQTPHAAARMAARKVAAYPMAGDTLPMRPILNLRSLGWSLVVLALCAGLMGLFVVGKG